MSTMGRMNRRDIFSPACLALQDGNHLPCTDDGANTPKPVCKWYFSVVLPILCWCWIESVDSKPASAKTITLHSNGSATVATREYDKDDSKQSNFVASKEEEDSSNADDPEEEEKAATKIQAAFRGHKTRKSMKQPTGKVEPSVASSQEPTREELEAEFRLDDAELCHAATKIQASFRGHMTRKQQDEKKSDDESGTSQSKPQEEEELDVDLTDPDLNKAAIKIQATFRGHMTRKDEKPEDK